MTDLDRRVAHAGEPRRGPDRRDPDRRDTGRRDTGRRRSAAALLLPPAASVLLLCWSATCLVPAMRLGPLATLVVALAPLTPAIVLAAVPLVTVGVRRQRWVSTGIAIVAALVPWVFVLGYGSASDVPPPRAASRVRLMIVNAHQGQASARDIVAAVSAHTVDVVVVTELSTVLAHDLTAAGLDRLITARWVRLPSLDQGAVEPVDAGIGVWSRYPLQDERPVDGTQWPALTGRIDAQGATFTLVTGHVAPPLPDHGAQWAADLTALRGAAARALPAGPVVVLGNLNATPWHADFRRFSRIGVVDAADVLGQGLRPTWPTWSLIPLLPLDHALVGGGVDVDAVDTAVIGGTDHRALIVTLQVPVSGGSAEGVS